ncbi:ABC transporter substrate-binding protein [Roseibium algae]|uniref:Probable sugar-binding periplasmic protein n=1 Tax=Roseibium algae TaxID=3123038 RepID=A0ABU8TRL0_9HYPH
MKFKNILLATTVALSMSIPAFAESEVEGIHHWVAESEVEALKVIIDNLSKEGFTWKDSAVGGMSGGNATQALRTRLAAGNPPATMQLLGFEGINWAKEGALQSLNDLYTENGWVDAVPPQIERFLKADGNYFSVPINMHRQNWIWANKAVFDEYDIAIPKTWNELIVSAKKLKKAGVTPIALSDENWQVLEMFEAIVAGQGGADFYKTAIVGLDEEALKSDTMIKAFDTLREIKGLVGENITGRDWAVATSMVASGEAAIQLMGDWAKGEFLAKGMRPGEDFLCFPAPSKTPNFTFIIDAFGMFKTDDANVKAGQVAWAKAIMDPEVQAQFNMIKGSIPARVDVSVENFDACAQQGYADREHAIEEGTLIPGLTEGFAVSPEFAGVFSDVVAQFFVTEMSSEDAVIALVAGINNAR